MSYVNLAQLSNRLCDGGGDFGGVTFTYVSATSMTVAGDWRGIFLRGTKIELYNNSTTKYGYIVDKSYNAGSGLTTISLSALNDSSGNILTLTSGSITMVKCGNSLFLRDHPNWINYTPSYTGFSSDPTATSSEFMCLGNYCIVNLQHFPAGTSNANTFTWSLPIQATSTSGYVAQCPTPFHENGGSAESNRGYGQVVASATSCSMFRASTAGGSPSGSGWTSSGGKRCRIEMRYRI